MQMALRPRPFLRVVVFFCCPVRRDTLHYTFARCSMQRVGSALNPKNKQWNSIEAHK